jgi:hypothetical protein
VPVCIRCNTRETYRKSGVWCLLCMSEILQLRDKLVGKLCKPVPELKD